VEHAHAIIDEAIRVMPNPYISFSGGIDSTALVDMMYSRGYRIEVLFGDDGWDYPDTLTFLSQTEARYGFTLRRVRSLDPWRSWCRELGRPDLAETPDAVENGQPVWGNPHVWHDQWRSLTLDAHPRGGYDGCFLGMLGTERKRGGESAARAYQLRNGARPLYQVASEGGMWHCSPLAAWTKNDVWAYVLSHQLSYNPVYDILARLGVPLERRRVAALTCYRTIRFGSHLWVKAGWPSLHNQLAAIFPGVRAIA
jgi:phosphoadenosine phosphosulfate reductase